MKNDASVISSPWNRRSFLKTGFNLAGKRVFRGSGCTSSRLRLSWSQGDSGQKSHACLRYRPTGAAACRFEGTEL